MRALLLADIQNDFCPGGALAVPAGDEVIEVANRLMGGFGVVVATQDWHPRGHGSFASRHGRKVGEIVDLAGRPQILWPEHCVQGTPGAQLARGLNLAGIDKVFRKGVHPDIDSYSAFFDSARGRSTHLARYLRARGVDELYVMGLTTDYCVKFTALDAVALGFRTHLIIDGCRGINVHDGDAAKAVEEMAKAGVMVLTSCHLMQQRKAA